MRKSLVAIDRAPLLSRTVQDSIQQYVIENGLRAGDALPSESELGRQLNVSRTSVREAVKALESLGVLESRRGSGVFVRAFSFSPLLENLPYGMLFDLGELSELLAVRKALELSMIEDALSLMTDDDRNRVREITAAMGKQAERGEMFVAEDRQFHHALFVSLGNATLLKLLDAFWLAFRKASERKTLGTTDPLRTYRDHVKVMEAVVAGDIGKARLALKQHYAGIEVRLQEATDD